MWFNAGTDSLKARHSQAFTAKQSIKFTLLLYGTYNFYANSTVDFFYKKICCLVFNLKVLRQLKNLERL